MSSILFICSAFAPRNIIGSIRPSKMAKFLVRLGHEVTVFMPEMAPGEPEDSLLMGPEMEKVKRIQVPYGKAYHKIRKTYKYGNGTTGSGVSNSISGFKGFARFAFFLLNDFTWSRKVIAAIKKDPPEAPYDAVISSYPNLSTHWAAAHVKRRGRARTWLADFRDPMVYDWQGRLQQMINKRLQRWVEKRSDAVLSVSRDAMAKFPDAAASGKLHWVPNGFDLDDIEYSGSKGLHPSVAIPRNINSKLVFAYTGGLYAGKRDLRVLFRVFRELIDSAILHESDIALLYAGNDGSILKKHASELGLVNLVHDFGFVERREALSIMRAADCTVLCTHNSREDQGVVPGKLYELLLIAKPIIAVINGDVPGSEAKKILEDTNAGIVYEEANHSLDYPLFKASIKSMLAQKARGESVQSLLDKQKREAFNYINITQNVLSIIGRLQLTIDHSERVSEK